MTKAHKPAHKQGAGKPMTPVKSLAFPRPPAKDGWSHNHSGPNPKKTKGR